jgi:hypothetical protein
MSRRFLPLLCAGVFALAGLTLAADEPPAKPDEPPLRLKKKKPAEEPPKAEPGKGEPAKPAKAAEKKEAPKAEDKEPEPEQPEIDEKEVLARITKNMRAVEEKLAKREITDGTRQTQDDILKDIDLLLEQSQRGGGGGAGTENQQQNQQEQNSQQNKGGSGSKNKSNGGKQKGSARACRRDVPPDDFPAEDCEPPPFEADCPAEPFCLPPLLLFLLPLPPLFCWLFCSC